MYYWPGALPPINVGDEITTDLGLDVSEMESGASRSRQIYDNLPITYSATMNCTLRQATIFRSFLKKIGRASFYVDLILPTALDAYRSQYEAKIQTNPNVTKITGGWCELSFELNIEDPGEPDFDDIVIEANFKDWQSALECFHTLANEVLPWIGGEPIINTYGYDAPQMMNEFDVLANTQLPQHLGV